MEDLSRRDFVRNGSASVVAIGTAGLAGCTSSLPGVDGGGDGGGNDEVGSWLVEPAFADVVDEDRLTREYGDGVDAELGDREFDYIDADAVFDNEEELVVYWPLDDGTGVRERTGVPAIDLDWQLDQRVTWELSAESGDSRGVDGTGSGSTELEISVLAGSLDPDEVETALENWADDRFGDRTEDDADDEEGFSKSGERDGYLLYEGGEYGFAVGSDRLVEVRTDPIVETAGALEQVLSAREDGTDRWSDDEEVRELLARAGVGHLTEGELHEPHDREALLAERIEQRFGVRTTDADELLAAQVEQRFGVATTDVDELLEQRVRDRYGIDDPDELSERERERLRDNIGREVASIEDDVERSLERIEDSIDVEDWEEGLAGSIRALEIDGETTGLTEAFRYESEDAADADALREHVDANRDVGDRWGTLEDHEIDASGAILVVTGTVRTRSLLF